MTTSRINNLRTAMEEAGLQALFITNPHNRKYISGFTGSSGYILITMDRAILFTDFRYMTQAPEQAKALEVLEHLPVVMDSVKEVLKASGIDKLGFEQADVAYGDYATYAAQLQSIELVPSDGLVEGLRMFKDAGELRIMQEAADLADRTFEHILTFIKPGLTELEVALEMEIFMRRNGATSSSFDTIVASGERSALPHGVASPRVIQGNEFIKLDFGAYYQDYCSDLTRTVVLGQHQPKHREIYDIVLEAQMHALDKIQPGMTGKEADALTRDIITRYGYGEYFGHGTGHGLGMEVHEAPRLSIRSETILKPGMTVTVEPGIYLPGFGGVRIEDDIVITENGIQILTHATKQFTTI
ncbi:Xaa-Pro dipeptidase [Paenibacillus swuensis]|uniref:Xaa-Pro dipeptidase n=1 Tax=Paenibacillus swuensis TaxID=1178515 RepID=A0A172TM93_9BACL|nr:Xaa-Pro peptidase family protein [Paenibacillus swuensis]ANE48086.1 Xaa-Pro dipeptidase [Paenibacillus swuensis]